MLKDRNQMKFILSTSYALKTIELTIVLLHFSYMLAMFWLILCESVEDFYHDTSYFELGVHDAK